MLSSKQLTKDKYVQESFIQNSRCYYNSHILVPLLYGDGEAQWISDLGDVQNKLLRFLSTLLGGMYAYDTD